MVPSAVLNWILENTRPYRLGIVGHFILKAGVMVALARRSVSAASHPIATWSHGAGCTNRVDLNCFIAFRVHDPRGVVVGVVSRREGEAGDEVGNNGTRQNGVDPAGWASTPVPEICFRGQAMYDHLLQ